MCAEKMGGGGGGGGVLVLIKAFLQKGYKF